MMGELLAIHLVFALPTDKLLQGLGLGRGPDGTGVCRGSLGQIVSLLFRFGPEWQRGG